MANPLNGNEFFQVTGVINGMPCGISETVTLQQVANLSGSVSSQQSVPGGTSSGTAALSSVVVWNSSVSSPKSTTIPTSTGSLKQIIVKDFFGNAGTYNITVTPVSGNIDGSSNFVLNINKQSTTFLDTTSGWIVI